MVLDPHHHAAANTTKVDVYAAMTFAPLSDTEASRCACRVCVCGKTVTSVPQQHVSSLASREQRTRMLPLCSHPRRRRHTTRYLHAWNDAAVQPRRKPVAVAAASVTAAPGTDTHGTVSATVRYVPRGGLAQEQGLTLDDIVFARRHFSRQTGGSGGAKAAASGSGGSRSTGGKAPGATGRQQQQQRTVTRSPGT